MTETGRAKGYDPTTGRTGGYDPTTGRTGGAERMLADLFADTYTDTYGPETAITIGARSGSYNPQEGL